MLKVKQNQKNYYRKSYGIYEGEELIRGFWSTEEGAKKALLKMRLKNSLNPHIVLWRMLENHDWYYAYSDDHRCYVNGQTELRLMSDFVKAHPETVGMYADYCIYRKDDSKTFSIETYTNIEDEINELKETVEQLEQELK